MIEENFRFRHREEEIPVRVRSGSPGDVSVSITLGGVVHDFRISRNFQSEGNGLFSGPGNHWRILEKEIKSSFIIKAGIRRCFFPIEKSIWRKEVAV
nr:Acetyl-CoA carboxylase biotin carboxyl carrier protein subunit [Leptospira interrogans serovar Copenhageni/Icterohaemorrhagiae]